MSAREMASLIREAGLSGGSGGDILQVRVEHVLQWTMDPVATRLLERLTNAWERDSRRAWQAGQGLAWAASVALILWGAAQVLHAWPTRLDSSSSPPPPSNAKETSASTSSSKDVTV
jgi:hypothetical protein